MEPCLQREIFQNVLDALNEGPLSSKEEQLLKSIRDNVIPLRRSWSVWGTIVAVAAVLLLFVQPVLNNPTMMTSYQEAERVGIKRVHRQEYIRLPNKKKKMKTTS